MFHVWKKGGDGDGAEVKYGPVRCFLLNRVVVVMAGDVVSGREVLIETWPFMRS